MPRTLGEVFAYPGVADAYRYRPPYPAEVFSILDRLIADRPSHVLDIGAGEGALARPLAQRVDHVDALDVSAAMVRAGRTRPGGRQPNLRWIVGQAESADLGGPYALVTAGASLHWMSWRPTLARLAAVMTKRAFIAIVDHAHHEVPWRASLTEIIRRHSRSPGYDPGFSLPAEISARGLFRIMGQERTAPVLFRQSVADYVEHFHSTASLARELMPASESAEFDAAVRELIKPYADNGSLAMSVVADVVWGRPARPG